MAGRNPTFSPLNTPHSRTSRLVFCLDIKLAIISTSPRLERRRGLLYFAPIQDPRLEVRLWGVFKGEKVGFRPAIEVVAESNPKSPFPLKYGL